MSGGHSDAVPPDPIPNSEVKRISGDGSVGFPHARVAHCQTPNYTKSPEQKTLGAFSYKRIRAMQLSNKPYPSGKARLSRVT